MKAVIEKLVNVAAEPWCRILRLSAIAEQCATMADKAIRQRQTYLRPLEALLAISPSAAKV